MKYYTRKVYFLLDLNTIELHIFQVLQSDESEV